MSLLACECENKGDRGIDDFFIPQYIHERVHRTRRNDQPH